MISFFLVACTPDLASGHTWDDGFPTDTSDTGVHPLVDLLPDGDGWVATIDATDAGGWVGLDLDAPAEVSTADPDWDLRFQRFHMSGNGGTTGEGGVHALFVPGASLASIDDVPDGPWLADAPDGPDDDDDPDYALSTWYAYNETTHVLTPVPGVWFVRSTEGQVFGLSIDTYYDAVGSSAYPRIRWVGPFGSTSP